MLKQKKAITLTAVILFVLLGCLLGWQIIRKNTKSADSELPQEAADVLLAYLHCDSYESLADCILPSAAAAEAKSGKPIVGDYSFSFLSAAHRDETILECSRLPRDQAERLGDFWSAGFSLQGFSTDFTAEDGYDVLVSAICSLEDEAEEETQIKVTRRLELLKIKHDRWIVVPSADTDSAAFEPVL